MRLWIYSGQLRRRLTQTLKCSPLLLDLVMCLWALLRNSNSTLKVRHRRKGLGSSSKHDDDGEKNVISLHILTMKTVVSHDLHELFLIFVLSQTFSSSFPRREVTFSFRRRIGYFLIQVYFPDIFVVMLSWIVFWMEIEDIGNRMSLGITCILTIMFLLGSLNGNLPKVSYPKALDWYLLMSFAFVFVALMEAVVVYVLNFSALKDKEEIKCKVCTKKKRRKYKCLLQGSGTFDLEYYLHSGCPKMSKNSELGVPRYALQRSPLVSDINIVSPNVPSSYQGRRSRLSASQSLMWLTWLPTKQTSCDHFRRSGWPLWHRTCIPNLENTAT